MSHGAAGWLWGLVDRAPAMIDLVLLERRNPGNPPQVRVHRRRALAPRSVKWRHGIPVTSPADTLLDLAGVMGPDELEAACALALSRRLTSREKLSAAVVESPPRRGIAGLRRLVTAKAPPALTRSSNERLMRRLVVEAELPDPEFNVEVCGKEFDIYWPQARLAVEVDAYGTHGAPLPFERDRRVDADFKASDIEVLRFTGNRIRGRPLAVVARLAAVLALRLGGLPVPHTRR